MMAWSLFQKNESSTHVEKLPAPNPTIDAAPVHGTLTNLGQESETLRNKVSALATRLDELRGLQEEFSSISSPLDGFLSRHAHAESRVKEAEAALAQQREASVSTRQELANLHNEFSALQADFARSEAEVTSLKTMHRDLMGDLDALRATHSEKTAFAESLERQVFAETSHNRELTLECQFLRAERENIENRSAELERDYRHAIETTTLMDADARRLQQVNDAQAAQIVATIAQIGEMEQKLHQTRLEFGVVQSRLAAEQDERERIVALHESDRSAKSAEIAALMARADGATTRVASLEKLVAQLRDHLNGKTDALRFTEKALKETETEKAASDRRSEIASQDVARATTTLHEALRLQNEMRERAEMLSRALNAKDSILENANARILSLTNRSEQMSARFERERGALEAESRKLSEDLNAERSERAIMQGALDIARGSRSKLMAELASLKRRAFDPSTDGAGSTGLVPAPEGNVHRLIKSDDGE